MKAPQEMSPAEWLSALRQKYGLARVSFPDAWLDAFSARIPLSHRAEMRRVWLARKGMSAEALHDELMKEYLDQILPVLRPDERQAAESTFFGILPTFQFNAYAGFTPRGDRVVILHEMLGATLAIWSHWYARMQDENKKDHLLGNSDELRNMLRYVHSLWSAQPFEGVLPDIHPKTEDSWHLDETLVMSAICFVIGHELGHVICGHQGYTADRRRNYAMEFEADRIGLSIVARHAVVKGALAKDTYHTKFALFGPLFALAVMAFFRNKSSETHPSATERRLRLVRSYRRVLRDFLDSEASSWRREIGSDVFKVLENNAHRLFWLMEEYRSMFDDVKLSVEAPAPPPWVRTELAAFRS
jgi:hypothetical protein